MIRNKKRRRIKAKDGQKFPSGDSCSDEYDYTSDAPFICVDDGDCSPGIERLRADGLITGPPDDGELW